MVEKGNDEPVSFSQAWSTGLIGRVIWKYTPGTGYTEATTLDPWEGYWVKCNVPDGVVLIVPGPQSRSRSRSVAASTGGASRAASEAKETWSMKLSARSSDGDAGIVTLGVAPGATSGFDNSYDAEMPPSYTKGVSIASPMSGRAGDQCAVDTRATGTAKTTWDVVVTPSAPNQDVVVRWQDIASTPKRCRLTIADQSTGRSQYMRTTSSYRFNSGDGSPRRFTVVADSSPAARLMISNIAVGPTRGSSVSVNYNISADAQVAVQVLGSSGKVMRRLEAGRPTRSGINSLAWDKRDDDGRVVATGMYLLQLTATTEDGEMVKSVHPMLIAR
jgi:hypothetical protein